MFLISFYTSKSVVFRYYKNQHTFLYSNFNEKIFFVYWKMLKEDIKDGNGLKFIPQTKISEMYINSMVYEVKFDHHMRNMCKVRLKKLCFVIHF